MADDAPSAPSRDGVWTTPDTREWRADAALPRTLGLGTLRIGLERPVVVIPLAVVIVALLLLAIAGAASGSLAVFLLGLVVALLFLAVLPISAAVSVRRLRGMIPPGSRYELRFLPRALRLLTPFGQDEVAYAAIERVEIAHGLGLVRLRGSGRARPIPRQLLEDGALRRLRSALEDGADSTATRAD